MSWSIMVIVMRWNVSLIRLSKMISSYAPIPHRPSWAHLRCLFGFTVSPYEVLGKTIDLTEKSDIPLHFDFGSRVEWFASPDKVYGKIGGNTNADYPDESPFERGTMKLTEDETGITFVLRGVLKNGDTFRMKLFAPVEAE